MVFLRKAGCRSKCRKVLLWFAVVWDYSVEFLESVGFVAGKCSISKKIKTRAACLRQWGSLCYLAGLRGLFQTGFRIHPHLTGSFEVEHID